MARILVTRAAALLAMALAMPLAAQDTPSLDLPDGLNRPRAETAAPAERSTLPLPRPTPVTPGGTLGIPDIDFSLKGERTVEGRPAAPEMQPSAAATPARRSPAASRDPEPSLTRPTTGNSAPAASPERLAPVAAEPLPDTAGTDAQFDPAFRAAPDAFPAATEPEKTSDETGLPWWAIGLVLIAVVAAMAWLRRKPGPGPSPAKSSGELAATTLPPSPQPTMQEPEPQPEPAPAGPIDEPALRVTIPTPAVSSAPPAPRAPRKIPKPDVSEVAAAAASGMPRYDRYGLPLGTAGPSPKKPALASTPKTAPKSLTRAGPVRYDAMGLPIPD